MARAGIALGSNVGDRLAHLKSARDRLREIHEGGSGAFLSSPVYETEPVGCEPGTLPFYNAAIELNTSLDPLRLLDLAQEIERNLGRPARRPKNAPRTIDVDLLYLGDGKFANDRLELPHPRLLSRRFVLAPLADIRPCLILPGHSRAIHECLRGLSTVEALPVRVTEMW